MFIDLCPGEWIRIGDNAILTVLDADGSRIQFALEGVDHVPDLDGKIGWDDQGSDTASPLNCH